MLLVFYVFSMFFLLNIIFGVILVILNLKGKESKCNICFIEIVLDKIDV